MCLKRSSCLCLPLASTQGLPHLPQTHRPTDSTQCVGQGLSRTNPLPGVVKLPHPDSNNIPSRLDWLFSSVSLTPCFEVSSAHNELIRVRWAWSLKPRVLRRGARLRPSSPGQGEDTLFPLSWQFYMSDHTTEIHQLEHRQVRKSTVYLTLPHITSLLQFDQKEIMTHLICMLCTSFDFTRTPTSRSRYDDSDMSFLFFQR